MKPRVTTESLEQYRRSYLGSVHCIWAKLPQTLIQEGERKSWKSIKTRAKQFLTGKWKPDPITTVTTQKKTKQTHAKYSKQPSDVFMLASGFSYESGQWIRI